LVNAVATISRTTPAIENSVTLNRRPVMTTALAAE
jgi:hypothetical protein